MSDQKDEAKLTQAAQLAQEAQIRATATAPMQRQCSDCQAMWFAKHFSWCQHQPHRQGGV